MEGFEGFTSFYRDRAEVLRAVTLVVGDHELANEAVDEAFVRAAERWERVSGFRNRDGWVYRVAVNWAVSRRRWKRRRPTASLEHLDIPQQDAVPDLDLQRQMVTLPIDQRHVLALRYILDLPVERTAQVLGVSPGTVKARTSRALQALRQPKAPSSPDRKAYR